MTFRQRFRKAADDIMMTIFLLILVTISGIALCLPAVEAMPTIVRQVLFQAARPVIVLTFLCLLSGMGHTNRKRGEQPMPPLPIPSFSIGHLGSVARQERLSRSSRRLPFTGIHWM